MNKVARPPVVVVLGHVDHGKTSLLDAIRKTNVTAREAGGITQSIGATRVVTPEGKEITFIDTPGHALFSNMRKHGATLADIAVLVVAVDDGVAPQTKEAIKILQESGTPFIVALTKIDIAGVNTETTLASLEKEGVFFEKRGGDIPWIGVSAKTGDGIKELLELINLFSSVQDISADPMGELEAVIIETTKDRRGLLISVIVRSGTLKVGQIIYVGKDQFKIRGLFNDLAKPIKEVLPGTPGQILGFDKEPKVGSLIKSAPYEIKLVAAKASVATKESDIKIFLKAKTLGSLEAILSNMPEGITVIGYGVGDVNENDIFLAKAANALVFVFEAKVSRQITKLADTESVKILTFDIVYSLIDELQKMIKDGIVEVYGKAQIMTTFPFNNKRVAGVKIITGKIEKSNKLKLVRDEKELGTVRIASLRKQKEEVTVVGQGEECGILFEPQLDFKVGDMLLSVANTK